MVKMMFPLILSPLPLGRLLRASHTSPMSLIYQHLHLVNIIYKHHRQHTNLSSVIHPKWQSENILGLCKAF